MNENILDARIPPHSIEAEQAVIGAIFLQPDSISKAAEVIDPHDFYRPSHQRIFQIMLNLFDRDTPVDLLTVATALRDQKLLEEIGGISYLTELSQSVPTASNIEYYVKIIDEKSLLRRLIQAATDIVTESFERENEIEAVISDAEKNILDVSNRRNTAAFKDIRSVLVKVYQHMDSLQERRGEVTGVPSGFVDLDKITAGFQKNDLIIIAARPSVGKTAFALNVAQNVAVNAREKVAIFSLEMGADQLVSRMLCSEGNIDAQNLRTGALTESEWDNFSLAVSSLSNTGIFIDDTPGIRVNEIRSKCRRLKKEHGLGLILIDYLQLIQGSSSGQKENRQQEVSEISRSLKALARELEVPVIALSQLSRGVEQRQDKRPMMSDLRESGSIEQDADIVGFLYRDDYYDTESEKKNIIEIIIAKQRNGPVGSVELGFKKEFNKFVNLDHKYSENDVPQY